MRLVVDTPVWSLLVRRPGVRSQVEENALRHLRQSARDNDAVLLGAVRQEVLSGMGAVEQYRSVRDRLRAFDDCPLLSNDYEDAAEAFNSCRARGIQGTPVDFLICAVAARLDLPILTLDRDFEHYSAVIDVRLVSLAS
jgi:predicted nucleic acid-binding protein